MGKAVKAVTKNPLRSLAAVGTLGGSELAIAAGKKLGIGLEDEQGAYATPEQAYQRAFQKAAADYSGTMGDAEKQVQESALTKGLFGEGGLQSRLGAEEQRLASQGFNLTPEDQDAYGQAASNIGRLFGQQEQAANASLARRGLASAGSGAAGAAFSGLQGNKNEMLAQAQTQVAQKRYQDTMQRLQATRNQMQSLGVQGQGLARERYSDRLGGLASAAGAEGAMNEQNRQTLADKEAAVRPGLFSTIGQGLQRGIGQMAQAAPGMVAGGLGGGGASMGGSALGGTQNTFAGQPTSPFSNRGYA